MVFAMRGMVPYGARSLAVMVHERRMGLEEDSARGAMRKHICS